MLYGLQINKIGATCVDEYKVVFSVHNAYKIKVVKQ